MDVAIRRGRPAREYRPPPTSRNDEDPSPGRVPALPTRRGASSARPKGSPMTIDGAVHERNDPGPARRVATAPGGPHSIYPRDVTKRPHDQTSGLSRSLPATASPPLGSRGTGRRPGAPLANSNWRRPVDEIGGRTASGSPHDLTVSKCSRVPTPGNARASLAETAAPAGRVRRAIMACPGNYVPSATPGSHLTGAHDHRTPGQVRRWPPGRLRRQYALPARHVDPRTGHGSRSPATVSRLHPRTPRGAHPHAAPPEERPTPGATPMHADAVSR